MSPHNSPCHIRELRFRALGRDTLLDRPRATSVEQGHGWGA
ncbi:hypothetical protein ABT144_22400 [Streptomyces sp. NPDC002039]